MITNLKMVERQMEWWIDGQKDGRYDELSGGFPSLRTRHQFLAFWHRRTLEIFVSETIVWYLTIHHWRFTSLYWEPSVWRNYRTKILFRLIGHWHLNINIRCHLASLKVIERRIDIPKNLNSVLLWKLEDFYFSALSKTYPK